MLRRTLRPAFVLAVLGSSAGAQLNYVSQLRSIDLEARAANPGGTPPTDAWSLAAPDFGPFTVTHSVQVANSFGSGFASATHTSALDPDRITGTGTTNANASSQFDPNAWGSGQAYVDMSVVFDVAQPVAYTLTGSLTIDDPSATPFVGLSYSSGAPVFSLSPTNMFGTTPLQRSGVLAPGTYTLWAGADAGANVTAFWWLDHRSSFQFEFRVAPIVVSPYCFGDGTGTVCPCGNSSAAGDEVGCLSSIGVGGKLRATGIPSLASDTLVLVGSQMTNGSALYFQGTLQDNGGNGSAFGDGKRCAAGTIARLGTRTNSGGSSQYPIGGEQPVSIRGSVAAPGTRTYQVWYRNVATFCAPQGFNLTNGLQVVWVL